MVCSQSLQQIVSPVAASELQDPVQHSPLQKSPGLPSGPA